MRSARYVLALVVVVSLALGVSAATAAAPAMWEDFADNPVVAPGKAYYPDVLYSQTRFDGNGQGVPYKMYYNDGGYDIWLAYSENGEEWTRFGSSPVVTGLGHPQVAYDASHFGDDAGDLIQASFSETYTVAPYYKMWAWDTGSGSRIMFAYSADGEAWHTNYPRDVCPRDEPGWLNPGSPVYDLEVLYDGNSGTYRGWADNNGRLYNVSSSDGTTWALNAVTPVAVDLGGVGTWDNTSLSRASVIKASATEWYMWYGGAGIYDGNVSGGGGNMGIGLATSTDGIVWAKAPGNPIVSLGGTGTFSGRGPVGSWHENRNYAMSVIYDPGFFDVRRGDATQFKMWRSGKSATGTYTIGFAQGDPGIIPRAHELFGDDRYATAVEVSKDVYYYGADTVVIATGRNWPDALGGTALAGAYDGPILLVRTDSLPDAVKAEITRLGATKAFILGGSGAVSEGVKKEIDDMGLTVTRLGGATRYETAELVAEETISKLKSGDGYDGTAFAATGRLFPDALSASPLAASQGWPIYLVRTSTGAPIIEMNAQGVTDVLILGGTGAVSSAHEQSLKTAFGYENVDRLGGADRYATSVDVATYGVDNAGLQWNWFALATGQLFPDALSGAMAPATEGSVIMLTRTSSLPPTVGTKIAEEGASIRHVFFIGGTGAISQGVRDDVAALLP